MDNQGGAGFRVPMLVISPYVPLGNGTQGGYISDTVYGFGSIVRFIEGTFKLGRLGTTDITTTSISDMFNFEQQPRGFKEVPQSMVRSSFFIKSPRAWRSTPNRLLLVRDSVVVGLIRSTTHPWAP